MKKIFCILMALLMLSGCAAADRDAEHDPIMFIHASDLHFLSPTLTDHGEFFTSFIRASDGKVMDYSSELTDAFLDEVISKKPSALILSGDLSYNGARESHMAFVSKLRRVQENGIPVLVIPGNHDINNPNAARFHGDSYTLVSSVSAEEFAGLYHEFGPAGALSTAPDTFSYVYELKDGLWVLMLDTSSAGNGILTDMTYTWLKSVLAQADGVKIIGVSHQNLLAHNELFTYGYVIGKAAKLTELYSEHGVLLNLSGHMHIQSTQNDGITEILTSALSITPSHYAQVRVSDGDWQYELFSTDVSSWAAKNGLTDVNLLQFDEYSRRFFEDSGRMSLYKSYDHSNIDDADFARMADTFAVLNRMFFTGEKPDLSLFGEGLALWEAEPVSFTKLYMQSVIDHAG